MYEEHHAIGLDGSGASEFRLAPGLAGADGTSLDAVRRAFESPGVRVEEIGVLPDGRLEARVAFDSWSALCGAPWLARACDYEAEGPERIRLAMAIPASPFPGGGSEPDLDGPQGRYENRFELGMRFDGRVIAHNADGALRRGNRLVWSRPFPTVVRDGLGVRVETDGASVFAYAARAVLRGALIAAFLAASSIVLLVLVGRRRLRREAASGDARG